MKKFIIIGLASTVFFACSNNAGDSGQTENKESSETVSIEEYDPHRGEGKFKDVELGPLNHELASKGKSVYEMKCSSCHKLTDERLVGPGWKGVTEKHRPEWILNFVTNPDPMIDKDPELQRQLEICLVRMPNQDVDDEAAFGLLEFMRQNDGVQ